MKEEFEEFPGRRNFVDVTQEGAPPADAGTIPAGMSSPVDQEEEEVRESALARRGETSGQSSSSSSSSSATSSSMPSQETTSQPEPELSQADVASLRGQHQAQ